MVLLLFEWNGEGYPGAGACGGVDEHAVHGSCGNFISVSIGCRGDLELDRVAGKQGKRGGVGIYALGRADLSHALTT